MEETGYERYSRIWKALHPIDAQRRVVVMAVIGLSRRWRTSRQGDGGENRGIVFQ